jgi:hypothetical protein
MLRAAFRQRPPTFFSASTTLSGVFWWRPKLNTSSPPCHRSRPSWVASPGRVGWLHHTASCEPLRGSSG